MQNERRARRGSSATTRANGSGQAPADEITLEGLADYDQAIAEIDAIIVQLEDGQRSLDEEMRLYERAMRLARACDQLLAGAELRIEKLRAEMGESETSFTLEDFELDDE
jgi:exodeoxyribonuclease VII small subunit